LFETETAEANVLYCPMKVRITKKYVFEGTCWQSHSKLEVV
jgi:hypothetical protein